MARTSLPPLAVAASAMPVALATQAAPSVNAVVTRADPEAEARVARLESELQAVRASLAEQQALIKEQALMNARNRAYTQQERIDEEANLTRTKAALEAALTRENALRQKLGTASRSVTAVGSTGEVPAKPSKAPVVANTTKADPVAHAMGPSSVPFVKGYSVIESDSRLVPVLLRWAKDAGVRVVLNGRSVTAQTLSEVDYSDLPLTHEARGIRGDAFASSVTALLNTYTSYKTDLAVSAAMKAPDTVEITTRRLPPPVAAATPKPANAPATSLAPTMTERAAPVAANQTPNSEPALVPVQSWDAPARKAAGVVSGTWLIGDRKSLRAVVEAWAVDSGYRVNWTSKQDPVVTGAVRAGQYTGTLQTALMQLSDAFGTFKTPLGMTFKGGAVNVFDI